MTFVDGSRNTFHKQYLSSGYWTTPIEMSEPPEELKWSPPSSWRATSWRRRSAALPRHNRRLPWSPALHKPFVLSSVACLVMLAETSGCNCTHISQEDSSIVTCVLCEAHSVKRTPCFPFSPTKPYFLLWSNNATSSFLISWITTNWIFPLPLETIWCNEGLILFSDLVGLICLI